MDHPTPTDLNRAHHQAIKSKSRASHRFPVVTLVMSSVSTTIGNRFFRTSGGCKRTFSVFTVASPVDSYRIFSTSTCGYCTNTQSHSLQNTLWGVVVHW